MVNLNRRDFMEILGLSGLSASTLVGCQNPGNEYYFMGRKLGIEYRDEIKNAADNYLVQLGIQILPILESQEDVGPILDWIIGQFISKGVNGLKLFEALNAVEATKQAMREHSPNNCYKLQGISDGALGVKFRDFSFLAQTLEFFPTCMGHLLSEKYQACSALAVRGNLTETGYPALIKDFDFENIVSGINIVRKTSPNFGMNSVDVTIAVLPGSVTTTNGYLAMTENWCLGEHTGNKYLPMSAVLQDAGEQCTTVNELFDFLKEKPTGGWCLVAAADYQNNIGHIECTPYEKTLHLASQDKDHHTLTNHFFGEHEGAVEDIDSAVDSGTHERYARIEKLVQGKTELRKDDLFEFMLDDGVRQDNTQNCALTYLDGNPRVYYRKKPNFDEEFVVGF